jgi:PTS system mannose-specific IIA component
MLGMIVVTHGPLAEALLATATMIIGSIKHAQAVSIDQGMSLDVAKAKLEVALANVDPDHAGAIILTDLFGGTPTNLSADFLPSGKVEILTGVNLPMVLKCATSRNQLKLEPLVETLKDYSRTAIIRPVDLINAG